MHDETRHGSRKKAGAGTDSYDQGESVMGLPTPAVLLELLRYDPETGKLFWLPRHDPAWTAKNAGKEAFTARNNGGYHIGGVFGIKYRAHRVIWAMQTGEWPVGIVDHADGDKANNRWNNLRLATRSENGYNSSLRRDNTSGVKGVCWAKRERMWRAEIVVSGERLSLGYFADIETAKSHVAQARANLHGQFARHS